MYKFLIELDWCNCTVTIQNIDDNFVETDYDENEVSRWFKDEEPVLNDLTLDSNPCFGYGVFYDPSQNKMVYTPLTENEYNDISEGDIKPIFFRNGLSHLYTVFMISTNEIEFV